MSKDEFIGLRREFHQWIGITSTSHQGPWQKAHHLTAALTAGATDTSDRVGGVVKASAVPFHAGGVFLQFWTRYPDTLRRAQIVVNVDNASVVGAFRKGRVKDPVTHGLLVKLFTLQVEFEFMLALEWALTADKGVENAISRPVRESIIRLAPLTFQELWEALGSFNFDIMASSESAQKVPGSNNRLPFFSQHDCEGSWGTDVLAQDVSRLPDTGERMFGYCFPPLVVVGVIVQHLAE